MTADNDVPPQPTWCASCSGSGMIYGSDFEDELGRAGFGAYPCERCDGAGRVQPNDETEGDDA